MSCFWSVLVFAACTAVGILGDPAGLLPTQVQNMQYRTAPPNEAKYQKVQYQPSIYRVVQLKPNEFETVGVLNLFPSSDVAYQTWATSSIANVTIANQTTDYMTTLNSTLELSTIISSATPFPLVPTYIDAVEYMHETQLWYDNGRNSSIIRTEVVDNDLPYF
ncbi:unnamed protein product [Meganyctiphanes norvegica]|uniref:Uncharacterized protein n=1 Tax=Meganyctiphanes norvegica TaxID=48144 RepID=A0AAV2RRN3_MEGNR